MPTENPLDRWIAVQLGSSTKLTRDMLVEHQLRCLRETVSWARAKSPFYRRALSNINPEQLTRMADLQSLPFTTAEDLRRNSPPLVCVSQSEISRVVTLETSGTSGEAKRLFFTLDEQESTIDFFQHGISLLAKPGDRVLILFPCERPGSIGQLLATALRRLKAIPISAGPVRDVEATLTLMAQQRPTVVAGTPIQVRALARCTTQSLGALLQIHSVLLSADHAAQCVREDIRQAWGSEVFEHYGMTEMGLGGGVDCAAHQGYHLREADLLFEIIDPVSGQQLPAGQSGEVVVTTLTRRGMPLIRYRTGDLSRLITEPCVCGSVLHRLEQIERRTCSEVTLSPGNALSMAALDEALFSREDITDFRVTLHRATPNQLHIELAHIPLAAPEIETLLSLTHCTLAEMPVIRNACSQSGLQVRLSVTPSPLCTTSAKRFIRVE